MDSSLVEADASNNVIAPISEAHSNFSELEPAWKSVREERANALTEARATAVNDRYMYAPMPCHSGLQSKPDALSRGRSQVPPDRVDEASLP